MSEEKTDYTTRRKILGWLIRELGFRLLIRRPKVVGMDHVPAQGPTLMIMNHTIAVDGVVLCGLMRSRFVVPMLKRETFQKPFLGFLVRNWGAIGIHRGEVDRESLRRTLNMVKEAQEIPLIAPEGTRSQQMQAPKDGIAYLALKSKALIVPVGLSNTDGWLEAMFLPWKRQPFQVKFGRPFRLQSPSKRASRDEMHQMSIEMMYQIAKLIPEANRGVFSDLSAATTTYLDFVD